MIPSRHEDYEEEGAIVTARSVSHMLSRVSIACVSAGYNVSGVGSDLLDGTQM